mmetsp:Transcript_71262/g.154857  ORF Transcript_71262/g.154857 Transcript_71262/m.154857 type:complete len:125 (+) Transcript_71262:75-449(+)
MAASASDADSASAEVASELDARAAEMRLYFQNTFGQQLQDTLKAVATERPEDAQMAMAKVFQGKKSLGEVAQDKKTTDVTLRSAAPRQYLHAAVGPLLVPALMRCYREQPRRPVSELGDIIAKR